MYGNRAAGHVMHSNKTKTMAQLTTNETTGNRKTRGVQRQKRLPTKVDMTPMVDLAFLLITFFIFTATMNEPVTMDLVMPKDGPVTKVKKTGALTLLLDKEDQLFYYDGELTDTSTIHPATVSSIRNIIIEKKKEVEARYITDPICEQAKAVNNEDVKDCRQQDFFVIIKPGKTTSYKSIVGVLDEMTINRVQRYALANTTPEEMARLPIAHD